MTKIPLVSRTIDGTIYSGTAKLEEEDSTN